MNLSELEPPLTAFCQEQTNDPEAAVSAIDVLPGHAGLSWGFTLRYTSGARPMEEPLVLRLPPAGVRWVGTADVLRQARVMQALRDTPVPVPAVRWAGDDLRWFGRPYFIVERLPGDTLRLADRDRSITLDAAGLRRVAEQVTAALAALHRVDWQAKLPDWGPPPALEDEVRRWDWLLERNADPSRTSDPSLTAAAHTVRERLLARLPEPPRPTVLHCDYN